MFNFFGSQYLVTKLFSKSEPQKSTYENLDEIDSLNISENKNKNTILWLKLSLFMLLTIYVGWFWYYSYHIREDRHIIAQSDLEFDGVGSEISSSCGVDAHFFFDYSGLSIQSGHKAFYEKEWPYISKIDTIYDGARRYFYFNERCVVSQPGVVLLRTDTIHGKIVRDSVKLDSIISREPICVNDLPKLSLRHAESMKRVFGDTMKLKDGDMRNLSCYYQTYIESPKLSSIIFFPPHFTPKRIKRRLRQEVDSLEHYKNISWLSLSANSDNERSLRINYFEPTDTIFYYQEAFRLYEKWGRMNFFSQCDLSRVTEHIDFHSCFENFDKYCEGEIDGKPFCASMNKKLNSVHFYFGTNVEIEGGNVAPDSLENGGFWIKNPQKLRQIEREGLTMHLLFPLMENMQNARLYLVTTILTALATYACVLANRLLRQKSLLFKKRCIIAGIIVSLIVIVLTLFHICA